jgi:hypothetical protein
VLIQCNDSRYNKHGPRRISPIDGHRGGGASSCQCRRDPHHTIAQSVPILSPSSGPAFLIFDIHSDTNPFQSSSSSCFAQCSTHYPTCIRSFSDHACHRLPIHKVRLGIEYPLPVQSALFSSTDSTPYLASGVRISQYDPPPSASPSSPNHTISTRAVPSLPRPRDCSRRCPPEAESVIATWMKNVGSDSKATEIDGGLREP